MEAPDTKLDFDPPTVLAALTESTAHLIVSAEGLDDEAVREPSLLPDWTRAHVLTHTARNADGLRNLLTWAATGQRVDMYPSVTARDQAIKDGAERTAAELAADLRESCERFAETAARLAPEHWAATVARRIGGPQQASRITWWRLEEVLIHHSDLDAGFTPAHWPAQFTGPELGMVVARFNNPELIKQSPSFRLHTEDTERYLAVQCAPLAAVTNGAGAVDALGAAAAGTAVAVAGTSETGAAAAAVDGTVPGRPPVHPSGDEAQIPTVEGPEPALLTWLIGRTSGDGLNVEPRGPLPALPVWM
jgi:maleylpyruvate isomerase